MSLRASQSAYLEIWGLFPLGSCTCVTREIIPAGNGRIVEVQANIVLWCFLWGPVVSYFTEEKAICDRHLPDSRRLVKTPTNENTTFRGKYVANSSLFRWEIATLILYWLEQLVPPLSKNVSKHSNVYGAHLPFAFWVFTLLWKCIFLGNPLIFNEGEDENVKILVAFYCLNLMTCTDSFQKFSEVSAPRSREER